MALREKVERNERALRFLSATGTLAPSVQAGFDEFRERHPESKRRIARADAIHKEPLERDIQKAIIQALRLHPRVLKVTRFNSGGSMHRDRYGNEQLVLFSSEPVPDLFVLLKGGFAWLEVKRPSFKATRDEREERQARFLACVREAGGIGCFVRSVDEALAAIAS